MAKTSVNWNVQNYDRQGALSEVMRTDLTIRFDIEECELDNLSNKLAFALAPDTARQSIVTIVRQMEKGPEQLETVLQDLRRAEHYLKRASQGFSNLRIDYPKAGHGTDDPNRLLHGLFDGAVTTVEEIDHCLTRSAGKYSARTLDVPDKRRTRDERRTIVLRQIFELWERIGRRVSYSTDGVTSERRGPLVDFVNAVVPLLSNPPATISGETIRNEMREWRTERDMMASVPTPE
ncbi:MULTISPECIES: hypothetical protein [unclassified Ruegeria]|uniref:hypothetical protein n=1 Tax=unclassified Ruegeria TaxID=2625375 RepID=UPI0014919B08|nr:MULTISPECIES: hypothetical protein [unclassified Ruegeria]NOD49264.1 hypothetical protein [Ruegeria sp. HKCCD5849]NOD53437.1 hypothetical protein [Ruegeria sp. HKCCD5851]NOD70253.1 hypothetical protein [Ruegeria sp. HKCCD7303]